MLAIFTVILLQVHIAKVLNAWLVIVLFMVAIFFRTCLKNGDHEMAYTLVCFLEVGRLKAMDEGGPKKIISIRTLNHFAV